MFNDLVRRYEVDVLGAEMSSDQDKATRALLPDFERLWYMMSALGVVSPNEQLDDISTSALELLWTPYVIADLYQRVQGAMAPPDAASSPGTSNAVPTCGMTREEALGRSHRWYDLFFQWALQCELVDERTLEKYRHYRAEQRTQRVELSQMCRELKQELSRCEDKVSYLQAKRRRMQQLMEQDGDELADEGGEEEEALRCRALARLRWSVYESCHQLQLSVRELEMLQALSLEKRAEIAAAHDRTLEAVRRGDLSLGRHTYTILPGGLIAPGGPFPLNQINSTAMNALANQHAFRQQVIDQLMIDRNTPTMTLAEFAEAEMADLQRRMDENAEAQRRQQEEDERLGPDGVEERQRQRDAKLADWKDDHAPIGQTAKGNYA
ncbi:hypothetical protein TRVL_01449 [Trypanosoma vivax]|nr:hypothetical protein TRVL_01449 [Trypanosoma vivax]